MTIENLNNRLMLETEHAKLKARHPDFILLMRDGSDYLLIGVDAEICRRVTGVSAGSVPVDGVEMFLRKLIVAGRKVALCEPTKAN